MSAKPDPIRYQATVDAKERNSSYVQIAELLAGHGPRVQRILEVGCSSGYLGAYLRSLGHWVAGVEPSPAAAAVARTALDELYEGDLEGYLRQRTQVEAFDTIVFGDVLEHLVDPASALQQCRPLLNPAGLVAISIPNITHGGIRALLLEGRWSYQDLGILDRTHLRLFSRAGLLELLDSTSFSVLEMCRTTMSIDALNRQYGFDLRRATIDVVQSVATDEDVDTFQFIAVAQQAPTQQDAVAANARWRALPLASGEPPRPTQRLRAIRRFARSRIRAMGAVLGWAR